jgi:hypothetical protein
MGACIGGNMEYEYGKIKRLSESLLKNKVPKNKYNQIMKHGEIIKKTSNNKEKALWFYNAMNIMDQLLDIDERKKIREDCACCLSGKRQIICKNANRESDTIELRIKAVNDTNYVFGNGVKKLGKGKYEVSFFNEDLPIKQCVCIKDLESAMSKTYCYCCGGHVKHHLETVLGSKLEVEVISSALSSKGKKNCRFILKEV